MNIKQFTKWLNFKEFEDYPFKVSDDGLDLFIHPDAPEDWLEYIPNNEQHLFEYQYFLKSMLKELDTIMQKKLQFNMTSLKFETKKVYQPTNEDLPCYDCYLQTSDIQIDHHPFDETHFRQKYLKENGPCSCYQSPLMPFSFCIAHFKAVSWTKAGLCLCFIYNEKAENEDYFKYHDDILVSVDLIPVFSNEKVNTSRLFSKVSFKAT